MNTQNKIKNLKSRQKKNLPKLRSNIHIIFLLFVITASIKPFNFFSTSKMRLNLYQRFIENHKKDHEHCQIYNHSDFTFTSARVSSSNRELNTSFIAEYLLSSERYFPIGNFENNTVHSKISKGFIGFNLSLTILSLLLVLLVIPCPFWPKSWNRVLKKPYDKYNFVLGEDDGVKDKQFMVKLHKKLQGIFFIKFVTFFKKGCIFFMLFFFFSTFFILKYQKFGEKSECGLVESIYDLFEGKRTPFFKEFGMVNHTNFLDSFVEELTKFKHELTNFDKVMEIDFAGDSRVIQNRFKDFYNNYKDYKIRTCFGQRSSKVVMPFQSWGLQNKKYLNKEIEKEVKEIVKFGEHIHKAAVNMRHFKDEDKNHIRKFQIALSRFKEHIFTMNQNFFNYYEGVLNKYKVMISRSKQSAYIIAISFIFYLATLVTPKKVFLRIQISLGLLCSAFLLWNGLKLYSEVIYRAKGCMAAYDIVHNKHFVDLYLVSKEKENYYVNSLYDWTENCFNYDSEGDIEGVIKGKDREELDYGLSILRGMSHDLSFLEEADYEPKAFKKFAEELQKFADYKQSNRIGISLSSFFLSDPNTILLKLNNIVRCTGNYFVLKEKDCEENSKIFSPGEALTDHVRGRYCIPVQKFQHLVLGPRYQDTCVEEKSLKQLQSYYTGLRACTEDHDRLSGLMIKDFEEIRNHVKEYLKKFKHIEEYYKVNRGKFEKSIKYFEERNLTLTGVMDCKEMVHYVRMGLGNACFDDYSIDVPFYSSLLVISSGVILLIVTLLRLVEVIRFWASRGDAGIGIELGGV